MTVEATIETLRVVNIVLASTALIAYMIRINNVWEKRTRGQRWIRVGVSMLLFAVAYASAEAFVQQTEIGLRTVLVTIACCIVLGGLWHIRKDPDHAHPWS